MPCPPPARRHPASWREPISSVAVLPQILVQRRQPRIARFADGEQVQQCIEVLDKDGDGEVSLDEFMALVQRPVKADRSSNKARSHLTVDASLVYVKVGQV